MPFKKTIFLENIGGMQFQIIVFSDEICHSASTFLSFN